jgi:DNA-binding MarR family transcriptional regulator
MVDSESSLASALFGEILTVHQLIRNQLDRVLPKGMELSHLTVLNHLANTKGEKTPAQLAKSFHVTRGAMTNTLGKLEISGYIHIRPDWDDARRKLVAISPAGVRARDDAIALVAPVISELVRDSGADEIKSVLPILRNLRIHLE